MIITLTLSSKVGEFPLWRKRGGPLFYCPKRSGLWTGNSPGPWKLSILHWVQPPRRRYYEQGEHAVSIDNNYSYTRPVQLKCAEIGDPCIDANCCDGLACDLESSEICIKCVEEGYHCIGTTNHLCCAGHFCDQFYHECKECHPRGDFCNGQDYECFDNARCRATSNGWICGYI